jgi:hypothetical protein
VIQLVGGVYSTRLPLMKVGIVSSMLYNRVQVPAPVILLDLFDFCSSSLIVFLVISTRGRAVAVDLY